MDDLDLLLEEFEDDLNEVIMEKVVPIVEEEFHEQSERIYDEYTPWGTNPYQRRYENNVQGSFGDREMIDTEVEGSIKNGEINLMTRNNSLANGTQKGKYLDSLIEEGTSYGWRHKGGNGQAGDGRPYDFAPPRPVSERVVEELNDNQKIENAIERGMKSKGYDIS